MHGTGGRGDDNSVLVLPFFCILLRHCSVFLLNCEWFFFKIYFVFSSSSSSLLDSPSPCFRGGFFSISLLTMRSVVFFWGVFFFLKIVLCFHVLKQSWFCLLFSLSNLWGPTPRDPGPKRAVCHITAVIAAGIALTEAVSLLLCWRGWGVFGVVCARSHSPPPLGRVSHTRAVSVSAPSPAVGEINGEPSSVATSPSPSCSSVLTAARAARRARTAASCARRSGVGETWCR